MPFPLFVALRHIRVRIRSTVLILLGVAVGVFVMTVMQSMMFGFQRQFMDILLTITPSILVKGRERGLPEEGRLYQPEPGRMVDPSRLKPAEKEKGIRNYRELSRRIEEIPGVTACAPMVQGRALLHFGSRERGVNLVGVDADQYDRVVEFRAKVTGDEEEIRRRRDGIILGFVLAEELGIVRGQRLRLVGTEGREEAVRVTGLFKSGITIVDRSSAFVDLPVAQRLLDFPIAATGMAIKVRDLEQAPLLARRVEAATGLESQSWQEGNANFFALMRQQNIIIFGAVAMTILVAGFGIANGLITAVLEKKQDIGILRAMGVTARGIAAVFVLEGLLIGILGAVVGMAAGSWVIDVMSHTRLPGRGGMSTADTFVMLRGPLVFVSSTFLALVVSLAASFFPALRAARYQPVDVIRTAK